MLHDKVESHLGDFLPREDVIPIPQCEELVVDYAIDRQILIYLFGIRERDKAKARLTAVSCLEFQKAKLPFRSVVVRQDFNSLSKADRQIITNAVDKQFTSLDEFDASGRDSI